MELEFYTFLMDQNLWVISHVIKHMGRVNLNIKIKNKLLELGSMTYSLVD